MTPSELMSSDTGDVDLDAFIKEYGGDLVTTPKLIERCGGYTVGGYNAKDGVTYWDATDLHNTPGEAFDAWYERQAN